MGAEICICIFSSAAGVTTGGHRQLATTGDTRPPRLPSDIRLVIRQVRSDAARSTQTAPGYRHRRTKPQKLKHRENQLHGAGHSPRAAAPGASGALLANCGWRTGTCAGAPTHPPGPPGTTTAVAISGFSSPYETQQAPHLAARGCLQASVESSNTRTEESCVDLGVQH